VARISSLGDGKAFGKKIIIFRIKKSSSLFTALSLSFSPTTTTTTEREREREGREREETDLVLSLRWWIKIKG